MKLTIAGREIDILHAFIVVGCELILLWIAKYIIESLVQNDAARITGLIAIAIIIVAAPVLYLYGPPWSAKQPQKPVTLFGGAPQAAKIPPAKPSAPSPKEEKEEIEKKPSPTVDELQR